MGKAAEELPFVDGTHPVYRAANNGDTGAVKRALDNLPNKKERWVAVNSRNEDAEDQSRCVAASRGYMLMAAHLLDAGLSSSRTRKDAPRSTSPPPTTIRTWSLSSSNAPRTSFRPRPPSPRAGTPDRRRPCTCARSRHRKMLWFRGCGDEDGGKTRVLWRATGGT